MNSEELSHLDSLSKILGNDSNYKGLVDMLPCQGAPIKKNLVSALMFYVCSRASKEAKVDGVDMSTVPNYKDLVGLLRACKENGFSLFPEKSGTFLHTAILIFPFIYQLYKSAGVSKSDLSEKYRAWHYASLSIPFQQSFMTIACENRDSPNTKDLWSFQNTPIHNIIANEAHGMLSSFLDGIIENTSYAIDLTVQDVEGKTAALLACKMRDGKALSTLINYANTYPDRVKLDIHVADNQGLSCLHYACLYKSSSLINLLSPAEENAKRKCTKGPLKQRTPVELLLFQFDVVVSQCLRSVCMFKRDIFDACQSPDSRADAIHEMEKSAGDYMLRFLSAKRQDFRAIFDFLGSARLNMHRSGASGNTALHFACRTGNRKHVQWLLAHGADARLRNAKGELPAERPTTKSILKLLHAPTYHGWQKEQASVCLPCTPS